MKINREVYFNLVREDPFPDKLSQQQVDGQNIILTTWEEQTEISDLRHLAYMLATTFHETAYTMWPIAEYGQGQGRPYGKIDPETGQAYYGRGFVQLTHRENYARADDKMNWSGTSSCEWHADLQLTPEYAAPTMFRGMSEGWFRTHRDGKKETLNRYFNHSTDDPFNARDIINGDKAKKDTHGVRIGDQIADYHKDFLTAVQAAVRVVPAPTPPTVEPPPPIPVILVSLQAPPGVTFSVVINGEVINV